MHGLVFLGECRTELKEVPTPEPGEGEAVVAIKASGMCGTDLHFYRSRRPLSAEAAAVIRGHEPCGIVHSIGPGAPAATPKVGTRVMVHHYKGCMACEHCRAGWTQMCDGIPMSRYGYELHGAHAPFMLVPAASLVPLDDRLSFEAGAAIGCGTGTAWGGLNRLGDIGGANLVIFGQGPVGQSATMLAAARGARVIAVDIEPARLERAVRFGAVETVDGRVPDVAAAIRSLTGGRGATLGLETSGSADATRALLASLEPWGRACFVGVGASIELPVAGNLTRQLTMMTSWTMSINDLDACARFVADRQLPIDDLFTDRWSLDQADDAYAEFVKQAGGKGVFVM